MNIIDINQAKAVMANLVKRDTQLRNQEQTGNPGNVDIELELNRLQEQLRQLQREAELLRRPQGAAARGGCMITLQLTRSEALAVVWALKKDAEYLTASQHKLCDLGDKAIADNFKAYANDAVALRAKVEATLKDQGV